MCGYVVIWEKQADGAPAEGVVGAIAGGGAGAAAGDGSGAATASAVAGGGGGSAAPGSAFVREHLRICILGFFFNHHYVI